MGQSISGMGMSVCMYVPICVYGMFACMKLWLHVILLKSLYNVILKEKLDEFQPRVCL